MNSPEYTAHIPLYYCSEGRSVPMLQGRPSLHADTCAQGSHSFIRLARLCLLSKALAAFLNSRVRECAVCSTHLHALGL